MMPRPTTILFASMGLLVCVALLFSQNTAVDDGIFDQAGIDREVPKDEGIEQRAQGPVHEAYMSPSIANAPQPMPLVPKAPPAPVEEMPPDQKPEGDNVQWLTGYWY